MTCSCDFELDVLLLLESLNKADQAKERINFYKHHPVLKIHDIAKAIYFLLTYRYKDQESKDRLLFYPKKTKDNTVLLFERACFLWGGLPYPSEHAELGMLFLLLAEFDESFFKEAKSMLAFQQATLSHNKTIFSSLFSQSPSKSIEKRNQLCHTFLSHMGESILENYSFLDEEIGFYMSRDNSFSLAFAGSGCKSGLGVFIKDDVGIINSGPHREPFEDCSSFGLAGRASNFNFEEEKGKKTCFFQGRIALANDRKTGFPFLQDSTFTKETIYFKASFKDTTLNNEVSIKDAGGDVGFSIFCQGLFCYILGDSTVQHRLRSGSLDSYKGPIKNLVLKGKERKVKIDFVSGCNYIEIFSLQGNEMFWQADFLILLKKIEEKLIYRFSF